MDDQFKRLVALQAGNRFLLGVAYRFIFGMMPAEMRDDLLTALRDPASRLLFMGGASDPESLVARSEIGAMIQNDIAAFVDHLEFPSLTS